MATPRPTPTALRTLRGDTSKGRNPINRAEPMVKVGVPKMPANLRDNVAKAKWRSFTKALDGYGILATIEQDVVAIFCNTWSLYQEAMRDVAGNGYTLHAANGSPMQNPAVNIESQARKDLLKMLLEFGLTPAARTKIVALADGPKDEFSVFLDESA